MTIGYQDGKTVRTSKRLSTSIWLMQAAVKHINRMVTAYLRDSSDSLENPSKNLVPDLKAIATDASAKNTVTVWTKV